MTEKEKSPSNNGQGSNTNNTKIGKTDLNTGSDRNTFQEHRPPTIEQTATEDMSNEEPTNKQAVGTDPEKNLHNPEFVKEQIAIINRKANSIKDEEEEEQEPKEHSLNMPSFPIHGFPHVIQEIINACVKVYQTPLDYWAGTALMLIALAIGDKLKLRDRYYNAAIIWMVLVGPVSAGKSFPFDLLARLFRTKDSLSFKENIEEKEQWKTIKGLSKKERMAAGYSDAKEPGHAFQLICSDFTPETMIDIHSVNNRGLLIYRDEISGYFANMNRYHKGSEQQTMLEVFSQKSWTVNRVGKATRHVEKPHVLLYGGIQEELLTDLGAEKRAENGFMSRIFPVWPDNVKKPYANDLKLSESVLEKWEGILSTLYNIKESFEFRLSDQAKKVHSRWQDKNTDMVNEEGSGYLKGVYGKLEFYVLRLAIIVKGMHMVCEGDNALYIEKEHMEAAIELVEYSRAAHLKIYRYLFLDKTKKPSAQEEAIRYVIENQKKRHDDNSPSVPKKVIADVFGTSRSRLDIILKRMGIKYP